MRALQVPAPDLFGEAEFNVSMSSFDHQGQEVDHSGQLVRTLSIAILYANAAP